MTLRFIFILICILISPAISSAENYNLTIKMLLGEGTKAYKAVLQGEPIPEATVTESFKLFVRELNGLGLGIEPLGAVTGEPEISEGVGSTSIISLKELPEGHEIVAMEGEGK